MADVLIVCVREDEPQAKSLADMFERAGFSVGGAPGNDAALRSSGAAVVVWSQASIRSRPFLDAAQRVVSAEKAVLACLIEPPPGESVKDAPSFDLSGWSGDPDDPLLDPLFFSVDRMVNSARASVGAAPAAPAARAAFEAPRNLRPTPATPPYARPARTAPPEPRQAPPATLPSGFQMRSGAAAAARAPLMPQQSAPQAQPQGDHLNSEADHWREIRHSDDAADFLDYLNRHGPDSAFAELAQLRLKQLEGGAPAPTPRPSVRPTVASPSAAAARAYEPQRRSAEPPTRRRDPPTLPRAFERERMPPDRLREPTRGGGGLPGLLLVLVIGGAAIAGGVYFGLGDEALKMLGPGSEQTSDTENVDPFPTYGDPVESASNEPDSAPQRASLNDVADRSPPQPRTASTERAQAAPSRQTQTASNSQNEPPVPAPRAWVEGTGGPVSLMPSDLGGASTQTAANSAAAPRNPPATQGPVSLSPSNPGANSGANPGAATTIPVSNPATQAAAPPAASVVWTRRPTSQSVGALYPRQALRDRQNGFVTLDCAVRADLQMSCTVVSETPAEEGFGRAALQVARDYRARATMSNGASSVGARSRIQVNFRAP
jgi:hypothetical protein